MAIVELSIPVANHREPPDKDLPLRDDIRLLGRVLGDTIRDQEGQVVFDLVEQIRQTSIRFHREEDETARRELEGILNGLSLDRTVQIVRAFSYFSHLANIAEDQHHIRRNRAHALAGSSPREDTLVHVLARACGAGIPSARLRSFFGDAVVSPVLTAHPTEVRRKSILDEDMKIARLLADRERGQSTPEEAATSDEALRRAVLTLWQTNTLRSTKPTVVDEVSNGLAYYDHTFLREIPRLYAALEDQLTVIDPTWSTDGIPSFLRMGSWIGGDRDGNPLVTAEVLHQALLMQSTRALSFHLDELHRLGSELSLAGRLVRTSEALRALAERSPDRSPHRRDEPYRRAISGIYARLAATARMLNAFEASHPVVVGEAPAYVAVAELQADLNILHSSLVENGSAVLARGRLRGIRRAVDVFGFHLASIDLRQNARCMTARWPSSSLPPVQGTSIVGCPKVHGLPCSCRNWQQRGRSSHLL